MSYDTEKNRQIAVSVGIQAAVALAAQTEGRDPFQHFTDIVDAVVEKCIELQAEHAVRDELGGTPVYVPPTPNPLATGTSVYTPPTSAPGVNFAALAAAYTPPVAVPAATPAPTPSPIPGATDGNPEVAAIWTEFFQDPSKFWNNTQNKKNPKGPDFKHKDDGDKALWITDKKNPSWVNQGLHQIGIR